MLFNPHFSLESMDLNIIQGIAQLLKLNIVYSISRDYLKDTAGWLDLRQAFSKKREWPGNLAFYPQVFSHKTGFLPDLSILDLMFNLGPGSQSYLINSLDSYRRERHETLYGLEFVETKKDASLIIKDAEQLLGTVKDIL